jgi:hypothetical protein
MQRFIIFIGFIFIISCFSNTCTGQTKTDSTAYLKKIGTEILVSLKISTLDEKYIYQLIDSIFVKDSTDRSFYFKVFNKIRKQATGYIREYIDLEAKEYCKYYPNEFFCMPDSCLKSYAYDIGEEIRTEEEDPPNYTKEYINEIKNKCDPKYLKKVENFSKDIFDVMESRK